MCRAFSLLCPQHLVTHQELLSKHRREGRGLRASGPRGDHPAGRVFSTAERLEPGQGDPPLSSAPFPSLFQAGSILGPRSPRRGQQQLAGLCGPPKEEWAVKGRGPRGPPAPTAPREEDPDHIRPRVGSHPEGLPDATMCHKQPLSQTALTC